jgi:hypothetical protein
LGEAEQENPVKKMAAEQGEIRNRFTAAEEIENTRIYSSAKTDKIYKPTLPAKKQTTLPVNINTSQSGYRIRSPARINQFSPVKVFRFPGAPGRGAAGIAGTSCRPASGHARGFCGPAG